MTTLLIVLFLLAVIGVLMALDISRMDFEDEQRKERRRG